MAGAGGIQESTIGSLPTTLTFRPEHAHIEVICPSRQVVDFDKVGQPKTRPNANRFYLENGFGTSIMTQFIVVIKDGETNEIWNCQIKNKQRRLIVNNGAYSIEVKISPNGLVCFPPTDQKQGQLPHYQANLKCILPVEEDEPITYHVKIRLYKNDIGGKRHLLDCVQYHISTHERGHDVFDYKEGRSITEVERPQLKIKMTGILSEAIARRIITHFQALGDNGMYRQFYADQRQLHQGLELLAQKHGQAYFRDLELSVLLEESIIQFGQNKMADCEQTSMRVIERIRERDSPNGPFLMAKAYYIIAAVYRRKGEFKRSKEYLEMSTELLEQSEVSEETAVNQYNWAALLAEMSVKGTLTLCEKKEADFRFQNTLLHLRTQTQNDSVRELMRVHIREINYHLKTSRQKCPDLSTQVPEEDFGKAARAIQNVERNLLSRSSKRHRVTYFIAKSDYHIRRASMGLRSVYTPDIRKNEAKKADSILKDALDMAEDLFLGKEIEGIEDRLEKIALNWLDTEYQRRAPMAIVRVRSEPVEQDEQSMVELLIELARQAPEIVMEQGNNPSQGHSSWAIVAASSGMHSNENDFQAPSQVSTQQPDLYDS